MSRRDDSSKGLNEHLNRRLSNVVRILDYQHCGMKLGKCGVSISGVREGLDRGVAGEFADCIEARRV